MNTAYMRNKWRKNPQRKKCLLLADICIAHGTGAAQCKSHLLQNPGHRSLQSPISHVMAFRFQLKLEVPTQPSAFGTWPLPYCWALRGTNPTTAHKHIQGIPLEGASSEAQLPKPEKPPWRRHSAPDVSRLEDSVVAPSSGDLLFIFPLPLANFLLPKSCQKSSQILGTTHMIFAADHILLNLSSSWHTQLMSLQRTIHPLPSGTWIQPPFPSTPVKIGHDLWKPSMALKTKDVLMMPD